MELDEPKPLVQIESNDNKNYSIKLVPNIAQDILATGPRYTTEMLNFYPANALGLHTSGVMRTYFMKPHIRKFHLISCYFL